MDGSGWADVAMRAPCVSAERSGAGRDGRRLRPQETSAPSTCRRQVHTTPAIVLVTPILLGAAPGRDVTGPGLVGFQAPGPAPGGDPGPGPRRDRV
ncbi:hypothetical protein Slala03_38050 [Streptomyces lavendulae subsp. lavendulae]|nr:hypothetical protein Slala03_38050 [Streptomyces lavendulae subsp. lavendulae]